VQPGCLACVAIASVAAIAAAPGYAADDVAVEAQRQGEAVQVQAHAVIEAPIGLVWQVLTDYERLPRFIPGISKSVIRDRRGTTLLLEQSGEARFLFFSFPIDVTLEVTESAPRWVASRAVSGNVRRMTGRYELTDEPAQRVMLRYTGLIEPDFRLPPLVGVAALRSTVAEQFTAMVAEIERRAAGER
jgi:ribosome-associated toxin RatA of RatAB toxin-antitoxin module